MYKVNNFRPIIRNYGLTSKEIRQQFLDYFIKNNGHNFIRSSPVVPYCDPSVVFVNAGMNQFKNVFLGKTTLPVQEVANSQKCIRVGGKHNDLSIVGTDSYHHTFFEMLGNWSFGSYFKKEACEYAWKLLTGPYQIDPRCLYVTYFGGNKSLNLPSDDECREIWRSLGLPEKRILPFGIKDNFWEMGTTGPCGPCTEIHIDHTRNVNDSLDRQKLVNYNHADLTELWNIVFIEYNRNADGTVSHLPKKHIDTGMGMERLVAFLQNRSSNYATDLFVPIFHQIYKATGAPAYQDVYSHNSNDLNKAYRIIADHSRMIVACLADGMFPDQNHKLRRVIRKTLNLSKRLFNHNNLLNETVPIVVEILGDTYPEMKTKFNQINKVIEHEHDLYTSLMQTTLKDLKDILNENSTIEEDDVISFPGFVLAYKELKSKCKGLSTLPGDLMFKLYDTYGLNEEIIEKIAKTENLQIDRNAFDIQMTKTKQRTKSLYNLTEDQISSAMKTVSLDLPATNNEYKYNYRYDKIKEEYEIDSVESKVLDLQEIDDSIGVILNKSNFYYESGGQERDIGRLIRNDGVQFKVDDVKFQNGHVIHMGTFSQGSFKVGDTIQTIVDAKRRTSAIRNHTATHLLNASVRHVTQCVTYQKSSSVTSDCLKLELGVLGTKKIQREQIDQIEKLLRKIIHSEIPIKKTSIDGYKLYASNNITLVPGEIYPDENIRIISIENQSDGFASNEPCCGTHASTTNELIDCCITNVKQTGRNSYFFIGVTGKRAKRAHELGHEMLNEMKQLKNEFLKKTEKNDKFQGKVLKFKMRLLEASHELIPYVVKSQCLNEVDEIDKQLKDSFKEFLREFVNIEMKAVLESCPPSKYPFIVHYLSCGGLMVDIPLHKATQHCTDRPIMILSLADSNLKVRCSVPTNQITDHFNAYRWIQEVSNIFNGSVITTSSGQKREHISNLKSRRIQVSQFEEQLDIALRRAKEFAKKYLTKSKNESRK